MNFDWTVTERVSHIQPWLGENFSGYFTDIQRAARKSLPRKPDRELKGLLGLTLTPRSLEASFTTAIEARSTSSIIQTSNRLPDYNTHAEPSFTEGIKSFFLCRNSQTDDCTKREKTVFACLIYFAIITVLLLIIVLILTTTLSRIRDEEDTNAKTAATNERPTPGSSTRLPELTSTDPARQLSSVTSSSTVRPTVLSTMSKHTSTKEPTPEPTSVPSISTTSPTTSVRQLTSKSSSSPGSKSSSKPTPSPTTSNVSTLASTILSSTTQPSLTTPPLPRLPRQSTNCTSNVCIAANNIFSRIDFSKSPCEDFYDFSCGGWKIEEQDISNTNSRNIPRSVQDERRQTLLLEIRDILQSPYSDDDDSFAAKATKSVYEACEESNQNVETLAALQEVHRFLDPLGMSQDGSISTTLGVLLRECLTQFQVTPFFQLTPTTIENENNVLVHGLRIEPLSMYLDANIYKQNVQLGQASYNYVEALTTILYTYLTSFGQSETVTGLGIGPTNKPVPRFDDLFRMVQKTFNVETKLLEILEESTASNISSPPTTSVQYNNYSSLTSRHKLELVCVTSNAVILAKHDWDTAVGDIADGILIETVNPVYFTGLNDWWISSDVIDMKLYVFVTLLSKRIWTYMPLPLRGLLSNIGANGDVYSEIDCVEHTLNLAGGEVHAVYIGSNTEKVLDNRMTLSNLKDDVIEHFLRFVSSASWILPNVERVVSARARSLNVNYSPLRTNVRQTSGISGGNQSFISLAVELHKQKHESSVTVLGNEVTEVPLDWTDIRPVYSTYFNTIGFPTALSVYLHEDITNLELYGHLGMLITEELIELLTGSPSAGFPPEWWGNDTLKAFNDDVTQCFMRQLTPYPSGTYDLVNVIKSNMAFQIVHQMYLTNDPNAGNTIQDTQFTRYMLFLTHAVQLHCVTEDHTTETASIAERVNNVLLNNINMKTTFECPDTSPLVNNDTTCLIFS